MQVEVFPLGPLETNSYLAIQDGSALAVDAGGDPAPMLEYLNLHKLSLSRILLTHLHFDHIYGVAALHQATGAPVSAGAKDAYLLDNELGQGGFMGLPKVERFAFETLEPGEIELLGQPCRVMLTSGHTPGSLSYYFPQAKVVFVGDLVFYRSIGRTDFPGGSFEDLIRSARESILSLPPETVIYSGHGPETGVGLERLHNPYFTEFAGQP